MIKFLWCFTNLFVILVATEVFGLPPCPKNQSIWTNCFGTYVHSVGYQYVGTWKNDKKHGKGTLTYPDGSKYEGGFKNDKFSGQGKVLVQSHDPSRLGGVLGPILPPREG